MPFWSHKSKILASTWKLELVPNPMLTLRVPQIRYQAQIEQAFQYVGFLKKFYVLCSEYRINPGRLNFYCGAVRRARPRKIRASSPYFVRHQKSAAQRWNRHLFSQFLHFLQKDPCFVSGKGLGFSILLVVSMRGWWGETFVFLFKCWMLFSQSFQRISKQQSLSYLVSCRNLICLCLLCIKTSEFKLACSESKVGPI